MQLHWVMFNNTMCDGIQGVEGALAPVGGTTGREPLLYPTCRNGACACGGARGMVATRRPSFRLRPATSAELQLLDTALAGGEEWVGECPPDVHLWD